MPNRLIRRLLVACLAAAPAASAQADWSPVPLALGPEPVLSLVPDEDKGLLILQTRRLSVADPRAGTLRRSFTLASQTDSLVAVVTGPAGWRLAARHGIWQSTDAGFSWEALVALAPRSQERWLGLGAIDNLLLGAGSGGLRRIEPGLVTAWGPLGKQAITRALSTEGRLLVQTNRGVYLAGGKTTRLGGRELFDVRAFTAATDGTLVATEAAIYLCAATCSHSLPIRGIKGFATRGGEYWAAASDAVWRAGPSALVWQRETGGLGGATPIDIAAWHGAVWVLTNRGLFRWDDPATAPAEAPLAGEALRSPSMAAVRRMVLANLAAHLTDAETWRQRARWKAAAPTLDISVRRGLDERSSMNTSSSIGISTTEGRILIAPEDASVGRASARDISYGLSLRWDLDDLVFHTQEISVSNELEDIFRLRESVVLDVTRLYYDRLRSIGALHGERDPSKRLELSLRVEELTSHLDFYTGGRFSANLGDEK